LLTRKPFRLVSTIAKLKTKKLVISEQTKWSMLFNARLREKSYQSLYVYSINSNSYLRLATSKK